jgi:hypothetical protein
VGVSICPAIPHRYKTNIQDEHSFYFIYLIFSINIQAELTRQKRIGTLQKLVLLAAAALLDEGNSLSHEKSRVKCLTPY